MIHRRRYCTIPIVAVIIATYGFLPNVSGGVSTKRTDSNARNIRFLNVTAQRISPPTSLSIRWSDFDGEDHSNITVQYRRQGENDWRRSIVVVNYSAIHDHHHHEIKDLKFCSNYEIRLLITSAAEKYYFSETTIAYSAQIPNRFEPVKPAIVSSTYDDRSETIDLEFSIGNKASSFLTLDPPHYLKAVVHVVDCRRNPDKKNRNAEGDDDDDNDFVAPAPSVEWSPSSNSTKGIVKFPKPYVDAARSGACQIMISISAQSTKICGRTVTLGGELLDNSVIAELSCATTRNLNCETTEPAESSAPRCDPQFVDAAQITTTAAKSGTSEGGIKTVVQLRIIWEFDNNNHTKTARSVEKVVRRRTPKKIILRYGYTDVPVDADPLFALLVPMHEIEKFRVDGSAKNTTTTISTNVSEASVEPDSVVQASDGSRRRIIRLHRVSICAVYGNDSEAEEGRINWAIIPSFTVKTSQENNKTAEVEGRRTPECKCEGDHKTSSSSATATTTTHNKPRPPAPKIISEAIELTTGGSSTTTSRAPAIVSSPSAFFEYENFWAKVAPLLAVFTVMTIVNIILLMASCYYYKRAKTLNALK